MKLVVHLRKEEKTTALRQEGQIPAVIYGKHIDQPLHVTCKKNDFIKRYKEAGYSTPLTLEGDGIDQLVLIQDIQVDPVSDVVLHADFLAVSKTEKVTTEVPVKLFGESPVEKLGEGKIQLVKDFIEVEAFPQDLPHDVQIDISVIQKMDDTVFVKDIKLSDKVTILDDLEQPLITVLKLVEEIEEVPVAVEEGATPAAEGEAGKTGEEAPESAGGEEEKK